MLHTLHKVHAIRVIQVHGEHPTIVTTYCGERIRHRDNLQRLSRDRRDVTCQRCRKLWLPRKRRSENR